MSGEISVLLQACRTEKQDASSGRPCTLAVSLCVEQGLFESISEELFRSDVSSTELRERGVVLPTS